jgi:hypothetical protein
MSFKIHSSALARLMKCAGVIKFDNLPAYVQAEVAAEGEAAGEFLTCMVEGRTPPTKAANGMQFDMEMADHAERELQRFPKGTQCEQACSWVSENGVQVSGRSDFMWETDATTLNITDYKYGFTLVDQFENYQLLSYAIGETIKRGKLYDFYNLSILQPRAFHEGDGTFRTWRITGQQLIEYKEKIEARFTEIIAGNESLVTGEHCKYCRVAEAGRCGAFNRAAINAVDVITTRQIDIQMSNEEIAQQYELFNRISDLLDIKLKSLGEQLKEKLQAGEAVGDYSLAPTGGRRVWKDGLNAETISVMTGIDKNLLNSLISPAQFEKIIGKQPELLSNFTAKIGGGFKVVKGKSTKQLATAFAGIKGV